MNLLLQFSQPSHYFPSLMSVYSFQHLFPDILKLRSSFQASELVSHPYKKKVKLYFRTFYKLCFQTGDGKTKNSELDGSNRSPNLSRESNSDLFLSFSDI
jgi:hypothetical protein